MNSLMLNFLDEVRELLNKVKGKTATEEEINTLILRCNTYQHVLRQDNQHKAGVI